MGEYVEIKSLPVAVQDALKALGYGRRDIEVKASETTVLSSSAGAGQRAFATLINLSTGQAQTQWGSWGGTNAFTSKAVDDDMTRYPLPANGVAIVGVKGGTIGVWAQLHVPASMVQGILPARGAELTTEELNALYCHKAYKGGHYRRDELARRKVSAATIDAMVERGFLARNKAGATSITTTGKNAVGDYRGY